MAHLIDKDALLAEIERLTNKMYYEPDDFKDVGAKIALDCLRDFINTLEVREMELEKESLTWEDIPTILTISEQLKTNWWFVDKTKNIGTQAFWEEVLKRFKAQKGEKV